MKRSHTIPTPRSRILTPWLVTAGLLTATLLVTLVSAIRAQDHGQKSSGQWPDLTAGLRETEGCLGVETADTGSGKKVIFAWFENKKACLRWYYSDMHQHMMHMVFSEEAQKEVGGKRKPLSTVPDGYEGPILAIASLTFAPPGSPGINGLAVPISQIAIELYLPLPGGLNLGGSFAPESMVVPGAETTAKKAAY